MRRYSLLPDADNDLVAASGIGEKNRAEFGAIVTCAIVEFLEATTAYPPGSNGWSIRTHRSQIPMHPYFTNFE